MTELEQRTKVSVSSDDNFGEKTMPLIAEPLSFHATQAPATGQLDNTLTIYATTLNNCSIYVSVNSLVCWSY